MARTNPAQFVQQVRAEASKVVWPTWKETWITTIMVFVMAVIAATLFFFIDQVLAFGVESVLGLGG